MMRLIDALIEFVVPATYGKTKKNEKRKEKACIKCFGGYSRIRTAALGTKVMLPTVSMRLNHLCLDSLLLLLSPCFATYLVVFSLFSVFLPPCLLAAPHSISLTAGRCEDTQTVTVVSRLFVVLHNLLRSVVLFEGCDYLKNKKKTKSHNCDALLVCRNIDYVHNV